MTERGRAIKGEFELNGEADSFIRSPRMNPAFAHIVPFAGWMGMLWFLDMPAIAPSWAYAARTVVGIATLMICRPWRWYSRGKLAHLPLALLVGLVVFAAWVFFESPWCPAALSDLYMKWAVRPFGEVRVDASPAPFDPAVCGWAFTWVRLAGSALVIPFIEEFFWRGFLYRWMLGGDFQTVDAGRMDVPRFLGVAVIFGVEHNEWLAGIVAGLAFGWLYWKTRDLWSACFAHVVANLALGLYVVHYHAWRFW